MPAYQVAGWTVAVVLLATAWPLASRTVALIVNDCVPSSCSSLAGTSKRATPEALVRAVPLPRDGSRYSEVR